MDYVMLNASDFLSPILHTHASNDLERAMAGIFTGIIQDLQIDQLNDIFDHGAPWQGSRTVVERFTKLNGLVVLRRDDEGLSDTLMSIIYSNWVAIASERGVSFLQFVLDMLYPEQNTIMRLWHSKARANSYPRYLSESRGGNRFLTSRVRIKMSADVNIAELSELTPTISRLVPWQVVPEVAVGIDTDDMGLVIAVAAKQYLIADFSPY